MPYVNVSVAQPQRQVVGVPSLDVGKLLDVAVERAADEREAEPAVDYSEVAVYQGKDGPSNDLGGSGVRCVARVGGWVGWGCSLHFTSLHSPYPSDYFHPPSRTAETR